MGCAIAYYLRKRHIAVTILERDTVGSQASGAAAGLLAPLGPLSGPGPFADLVLTSFALFPALVKELESASGLSLGYEVTGALRTVRNPRRIAHLRKRLQAWQPLDLELHWLEGNEARQLEPLLAPDIQAAIYAPQEAQMQAAQFVQALRLAAQKLGANIVQHREVCGLETHNKRVIGVRTRQGESFACQHLIIAAGAWTARCSEWLNVSIPLGPLHGQMLALDQASASLKHIIFGEAIYLAPRGANIIVGATRNELGFDLSVSEAGSSWLNTTAIRLVPELAQSQRKSAWAGLRPKTPDSRPILGAVPGWENVSIAAGHNSVGIMLSPITGLTIAELVATGKLNELISQFSLKRFAAQL
ncbi:glycine oxidase ThiO [Ktedonosporobacter rubrisoli]|uniref:glycine oxidase n=1 Tax=Ktedonosporobacter rubrisoli TaxID=2509675 RepID=A0A4V0YY25_KTERU|nr:glycine oxidase ThiO [Ktedonosporobacter rubrisoli]QBD74741.1 glycine oxidase ThiO [Ktedonosporobacter rubrisoli]